MNQSERANRVLVADPLAEDGLVLLRQATGSVDVRTKLPESELVEAIKEYDALVVRSETKVTERVLEAGRRLKVVGRAGGALLLERVEG